MEHYPRVLPFYMTWPMPLFYGGEDTAVRDLEYLQELYPEQVRRCREKICRLLDRFDYEGSAIYDEYPDRLTLFKLAGDIAETVRREEEREADGSDAAPTPQTAELVQVLLYHEIFLRRRRR
ncbi:MAG: hypothetical protein Q4C65_10640 [Eubacteriales bacterium]|nr:hypothetical protein [Eubacteriales bacterium]